MKHLFFAMFAVVGVSSLCLATGGTFDFARRLGANSHITNLSLYRKEADGIRYEATRAYNRQGRTKPARTLVHREKAPKQPTYHQKKVMKRNGMM